MLRLRARRRASSSVRCRFLLVIFRGGFARAVADEYAAVKPVSATTMALLSSSGLEGLSRPGGAAVVVPVPQSRRGFVAPSPKMGEGGDLFGERGEDMRALYPVVGTERSSFHNVEGAREGARTHAPNVGGVRSDARTVAGGGGGGSNVATSSDGPTILGEGRLLSASNVENPRQGSRMIIDEGEGAPHMGEAGSRSFTTEEKGRGDGNLGQRRSSRGSTLLGEGGLQPYSNVGSARQGSRMLTDKSEEGPNVGGPGSRAFVSKERGGAERNFAQEADAPMMTPLRAMTAGAGGIA